ncbi:recombinase family protein [Paenibacillus anseongense]|uniref:recombinase family protein n=1 Tax=Paenibacillus anseongense TaxID=2682845 RepID=UPI002DB7A873|nr:recombinase family protein [Paenibacillus anseongense]MEC0265148.1 recombinase family protein [Paenibacillus anseongense]
MESKIYGYARVSSQDQNLATQQEQLSKFGVNEIVKEKISGVIKAKPKLETLIEKLNEGDTLVVTRMDRLGRNTIQLLELVEYFTEKNIYLVIMDINIDTRTPTGKFFLTVMAGFSELERTIIKEKQRNGIEIAKQAGKYKGRPFKYSSKHDGMNHAIELFKVGDKTVKEICNITKVSRSALYRKLQELEINHSN